MTTIGLDFIDPLTAESFAQDFGCTVVEVRDDGPGGHHPLVTFEGDHDNIAKLLWAYTDWETGKA